MTDSPPISLVCFDLASIVIDDSIVERAFTEAIATQGIVAGTQDYARSMVRFDRSLGRAPAAVLRDLFDDEPRAQAALLALLHEADLVLCADDAPRGFPWPDAVLTAMLRLGAADVREVAVVSATPDGVLSGYRAGARILVGVGSGRRGAALREAGATHVLDNITALPELVAGSA